MKMEGAALRLLLAPKTLIFVDSVNLRHLEDHLRDGSLSISQNLGNTSHVATQAIRFDFWQRFSRYHG